MPAGARCGPCAWAPNPAARPPPAPAPAGPPPPPRADLRVLALDLAPGPGQRYDITLRNAGRSDAAASVVRLALPDGTLLYAGVPPIAPGDRENVFVTGPACRAGDAAVVSADAGD